MTAQTPVSVRPPAVAGLFYPGESGALSRTVDALLAAVEQPGPAPKALVVPHAGYPYSGAVAARAYALLAPLADRITRVVLLGPSHRVALCGMALPAVDAFDTPLGRVALDRPAIDRLAALPGVQVADAPHRQDHALEVQLPFLQALLPAFSLVPVAVGPCAPDAVADALDAVWGGSETLVVVSSDLSHFHAYDRARVLDAVTSEAILARHSDLSGEQACGCHALNGLLTLARRRGLAVELLARCNSGDTAGDRSRVVGYASFALHAAPDDAGDAATNSS